MGPIKCLAGCKRMHYIPWEKREQTKVVCPVPWTRLEIPRLWSYGHKGFANVPRVFELCAPLGMGPSYKRTKSRVSVGLHSKVCVMASSHHVHRRAFYLSIPFSSPWYMTTAILKNVQLGAMSFPSQTRLRRCGPQSPRSLLALGSSCCFLAFGKAAIRGA